MLLGEAVECCTLDDESPIAESITSLRSDPRRRRRGCTEIAWNTKIGEHSCCECRKWDEFMPCKHHQRVLQSADMIDAYNVPNFFFLRKILNSNRTIQIEHRNYFQISYITLIFTIQTISKAISDERHDYPP
ncbi:hypothetical protein L2E82_39282 [Cichorium intybus]|uniref:Uncharacterized protein n=1 Tax=Cichorium intybus TaxID=13427 RepID=A0ACB9AHS7_CICIN|nr:hypothetical protein L2E82_39282 [Cichorium intybus]